MNFKLYIEPYLEERSKRLSPRTIKDTRWLLGFMCRSFDNHKSDDLAGISASSVQALHTHEVARGVHPHTVHLRFLDWRRFLSWLYKEGYILQKPFALEILGRKPQLLPRSSPPEIEVHHLLYREDMGKRYPKRNKAIIELIYGCGLRIGEVKGLNIEDVTGESIQVLGKGNKMRLVPLGKKAREAINIYLKTDRQKLLLSSQVQSPALFISEKGNRLANEIMSHIFRHQIKSPYKAHQYRHACATHMLGRGCGVHVIQKLLGHSYINTTMVYTHVDVSDLKKMLKQRHPRG